MPDSPPSAPIAFLNGKFLPFREAALPVFDLGVMQGATLTERLRTIRHQPYLVTEHLDRLQSGLHALGWQLPSSIANLDDVIQRVTDANAQLISEDDDLAIVLFVTAGQHVPDANGLVSQSTPTVCVYTTPLPFHSWKPAHESGVRLAIPSVRQLPADVLDPRLKHRSRLHWHLAGRQANEVEPAAWPLLLDDEGFVTETASGNLFLVRDGRIQTPRAETTLGGIAQTQVIKFAEALGVPVQRADLTPDALFTADEAFLTSSTYCILPVSHLNGTRIGTNIPAPITKKLVDAWSQAVGLDLKAQILKQG